MGLKEYDMKYIFECDNKNDAKTLVKAEDMAMMLWELKHNFWRKWKHDDSALNIDTLRDELGELFYEYNIDPDDLIE